MKKEREENPAAKAALELEWNKLRKVGCWDESKVREKQSVIDEYRGKGKCHFGRIFAIGSSS